MLNLKNSALLIIAASFLLMPFSYQVAFGEAIQNQSTTQNSEKWFFNIRTPEGTLTENNGTIVLQLKNPLILANTDRPYRSYGAISSQELLNIWYKGPDNFKIDHPNAVVSFYLDSFSNNAFTGGNFILSKPVVNGTTLSFTLQGNVKQLNSKEPIISAPVHGISVQIDTVQGNQNSLFTGNGTF